MSASVLSVLRTPTVWVIGLVLALAGLSFVVFSPAAKADGAKFIVMASGDDAEPMPWTFHRDGQLIDVNHDDHSSDAHPVYHDESVTNIWHEYAAPPSLAYQDLEGYPGLSCWIFDHWEITQSGVSSNGSNPLDIQVNEDTRLVNARYVRSDLPSCGIQNYPYPESGPF